MKEIANTLIDNLNQILVTLLTALIGYISIKIKNYLNDKMAKDIVLKVVQYVEQTKKNESCSTKKKLAYDLSLNWLKAKKISISETELDILIESSVKCLD